MTSEANTSCLRKREMRARGTGDGVFANDNCRRLNDNYEPRQIDITNLAMTGRSSCRRPAILVDVDHGGIDRCRRISAWAEEPEKAPGLERVTAAHLRVGGGTGIT